MLVSHHVWWAVPQTDPSCCDEVADADSAAMVHPAGASTAVDEGQEEHRRL
jgi:hypothetical protein